MNKENVPESEMDEIDSFIAQIDGILERLDPPSPLMPDDPDGTEQEWIMKKRLILCFPNLNRKDRRMILRLYYNAYFVTLFSVDEPAMVEKYGPDYRAEFLESEKRSYEKRLKKMEQYALRVKLSDFQERLLDRFIEVCPAIQW